MEVLDPCISEPRLRLSQFLVQSFVKSNQQTNWNYGLEVSGMLYGSLSYIDWMTAVEY